MGNKNEDSGFHVKPFIFAVEPVPKPRMTRSDRWNERPATSRYWAFKDELCYAANKGGYKVPAVLSVWFYLPMPQSWSKKKQESMYGKPHQSKPDLDNLLKAFKDALCEDDSYVHHYIDVRKIWATRGRIEAWDVSEVGGDQRVPRVLPT